MEGDISGALGQLGDGWEVLRSEDWVGVVVLAGAGLALGFAFSGDTGKARTVLADAYRARRNGLNWFDPLLEISAAWIEAADGDVASAAARLQDVAESARGRSQFPYEVHSRHGLARLGRADDALERLEALACVVEGPFAAVAASQARAMAASDPTALKAAANGWEGLGMRILAAEAASLASSFYRARGQRSQVASLDAHCDDLLSRCPGAVSPVVESLRRRPILSQRELEVARMAAVGRSSRQIAEQLVVSIRTVESHLGHVYTKLGVAGREELADALGTRGEPR
jgi:ATP/maltotriose-dependent transcriptional regulator MalT